MKGTGEQRGMNRKAFGAGGEDVACDHLRGKRYKIISRNYRCWIGEVDIVALRGKTLVFCEVKARNNREFGEPFEAVTKHKQKRLRRLAESYLQSTQNDSSIPRDLDYRFDVISIVFNQNNEFELVHLENAF